MTGSASVVAINVFQGEYRVSDCPLAVLSTVLGSCVAVCLNDPYRRIGGMNHFLLPQRDGKDGENERYGAYSMEILINTLLKSGARKERLRAKIFGGARMTAALQDIGQLNADFARGFLNAEGIPCDAESLGGTAARRIRFWPAEGGVKQLLVPGGNDPAITAPPIKAATPMPDVTLF